MMCAKRFVLVAALAGVAVLTGGIANAADSKPFELGPPLPQEPATDRGGPAPQESELLRKAPVMDEFSLRLDRADLLIGDQRMKRVANPSTGQAMGEHPIYLAESALEEEKPNIHGFIELPFKTAYVTPRGLVVENSGVVFQPVGGFVFPIGDLGPFKGFTFVTGIWNSINSAQDDTNVGGWNENDFFASFSWNLGPTAMTLTYGAWNFPQSTVNKPSTEHNIDLKIAYDDSKMWGDSGFALNPYVDLWWAVAGSSTVVLGKEGDTGYVEIGLSPSFTVNASPDLPIKLAFPTYISVGPEGYWGKENPDGHFGVFCTSAVATIPLNFIPARLGHWHATASISYFYLINDNLLEAGEILSGNDNRNVFVGSLGVGMSF